MIWESVNSIWLLLRRILLQPMRSIRKWAVSALKTQRWGSILLQTLMAIGWKSYRKNGDRLKASHKKLAVSDGIRYVQCQVMCILAGLGLDGKEKRFG